MRAAGSETIQTAKRFYRDVTVVSQDAGFAINLDKNTLKTPGRAAFIVSAKALAGAVAEEWRGQGARIDPATMPLTALLNTAIDQVPQNTDAVRDDIVKFAASDLVCYRAEAPAGLVQQQNIHWDPVLAWSEIELDARFVRAGGIMPVEQSQLCLDRIGEALAAAGPFALAATHMVTSLTGSALLALALARGQMDAETVWRAAHVDEDWQIDNWGEDDEARVRRASRRLVYDAASLVLEHSPP